MLNPTARIVRFAEKLQGYDFEISHIRGVNNTVADALSRALVCLSGEEFAFEQEKDLHCYHLKKILTKEDQERTPEERQTIENYSLDVGRVHFETKLVVPSHLVRNLMEHFHESPEGAHFGPRRMLETLKKRFFWPGMKGDVNLLPRVSYMSAVQQGRGKTKRSDGRGSGESAYGLLEPGLRWAFETLTKEETIRPCRD